MAILLAICVLGYIFLSPIILLVLYFKQRKTITWMEEELRILRDSLQDQRERLANMRQQEAPPQKAPEPEPVQEPVSPAPKPAQPLSTPAPARKEPALEKQEPAPAAPAEPIAPVHPVDEVHEVHFSEKLRPFLQGIGMWPPSDEAGMGREALLMQWWLPRIAGILALLSALFFGVYINQDTSAAFKCIELIVVSLGVAGLGRFMERKYKTFGGVLVTTGLIMLYLTSVSAYALPATRVIENPLAGSLVQAAVLLVICVIGLLRQSKGLVLLAFNFGYFLGLFMVHEGLREGALIEAGMLFVAGMALSKRASLKELTWISIIGANLVVLAFPILGLVKPVDLPEGVSVQVFINLVFAGVVVAYFMGILHQGRIARIQLSVGSSLAILGIFCYFRSFQSADLEWASLVLGVVMLAASIVGWSKRGCGYLAQLLFIKAVFLIGVWAILHYAGDLRWMVLALQTVVVVAAARQSRVLAFELTAWAVAFVSLVFFLDALDGLHQQGTFVWWMMILYPIVITLALAALMKQLDKPLGDIREMSRAWAYFLVPLVCVLLWEILLQRTTQRGFEIALPFILLVYVAGGLSLVPFISRWMLLELAALAFLMGSFHFCDEPFSILQLAGIIAAAAVALRFLLRRDDKWSIVAESVVYLVTIIPISLWTLQVLDNWAGQAIIVYILCALIVLAGMIPGIRQLGSWAFVPLVVLLMSEQAAAGAGFLNIIAFLAGLGWLAIPVLLPMVKQGQGWAIRNDIWALIGAFLFWIYALLFGDPEATWMAGQWVLGILAILFLLGTYKWKMHGYMLAALLFVVTVFIRHSLAMGMELNYVPWKSEALMSAVLLYAFALLWFFLKPKPLPDAASNVVNSIDQAGSTLSALMLFLISVVTFLYEELGWINWFTPIIAVTVFAIILLGLFFRDPVFRRIGIVLLLVPLVRLFLIDVQDVLHRIIAFAAAGILLFVLAYFYNRLSRYLADEEVSGDETPDEGN